VQQISGREKGIVTSGKSFYRVKFSIMVAYERKVMHDLCIWQQKMLRKPGYAAMYGHAVSDYRERVYILHIFQLAFSSAKHRRSLFLSMQNWVDISRELPEDIHQFDWRSFQQNTETSIQCYHMRWVERQYQ
jgi:hypothetical protein